MGVSIILVILLFFTACNPKEQSYPNIVWLTTEDNSPHYIKLYNGDGVTMPAIEKLAKDELKFGEAPDINERKGKMKFPDIVGY